MRHHQRATAGGLAALLLATAAPPALAAGKTERVSVSAAGAQGDALSVRPSITGNGAAVAFESDAANLVPGDTNESRDIFVRDQARGTTVRASVGAAGVQGDGPSEVPLISREGRREAFLSRATNLVPGDTNGRHDVFVRDLEAGTTVRASVGPAGQRIDDVAGPLAISADARLVVFAAQEDLGHDKYLNTLLTRDLGAGTTTVESRNAQGQLADGEFLGTAMTPGRYVLLWSDSADILPGDANGGGDIFVHDRLTGRTVLASAKANGAFARRGGGVGGSISLNGRHVAFDSTASTLVPGDTNGTLDVFVRKLPPPAAR